MIIKLVKLIVLLSFFTLNIFSSIGQNESSKSEFYRISGKIQDAESGDMIQLAHIVLQEYNIANFNQIQDITLNVGLYLIYSLPVC